MASLFQRVRFIYGNTGDTFYENDVSNIDIKELFVRKLKEEGYKRIVFYNHTDKIYFFDSDSRYNTINLDAPLTTTSAPYRRPKVSGSVLRGSRLVQRPEEAHDYGSDESLNCGISSDTFVLARFDALMRDTKLRTAIVIDNLGNFLTYFGAKERFDLSPDFDTKLGQWVSELPADNLNSICFILPDRMDTPEEIEKAYQYNGIWKNNLSQAFNNKENHIYITKAFHGEICNFLSYLRLAKRIRIDMHAKDFIADAIISYSMRKNMNLKEIEQYIALKDVKDLTKDTVKSLFEYNVKSVKEDFEELVGMQSLKDELNRLEKKASLNKELGRERIDYSYKRRVDNSQTMISANKANLHYALVGAPGTGKTTAAALLGRYFKELGYLPSGHMVKALRGDLVAGYVGQTAQRTTEKIKEAMGGVLFIDEAYDLYKEDSQDFGHEAITTILEAMSAHEGEFAVIIAGYKKEINHFIKNGNPGLERRFNKVIELEDYSSDELLEIFRRNAIKQGYSYTKDFENSLLKYLEYKLRFKTENTGNAGLVMKLSDEIYSNWAANPNSITEDGKPRFALDDLPKEAIKAISSKNEYNEDELLGELDSMIGLKAVKEKLTQIAVSALFARQTGEKVTPGNYMFRGNPGTGKTTVARFVGKILFQAGVLPTDEVIETEAKDFIGDVVGGSEKKTNEILSKSIGKVLFIDECYSFANKSEFGKSAFDQIIKFMYDNKDSLCIIFAGYPKEVAELNKMNSGFESRIIPIDFENYSVEELKAILDKMRGSYNLDESFMQKFTTHMSERIHASNFGNAREVETILRESKKAMQLRLLKEYMNVKRIPQDKMYLITGVDFSE